MVKDSVKQWRDLVIKRDDQLRAREIESGVDAREAAFRSYARRLQLNVQGIPPSGTLWKLLCRQVKSWMTVLDVGSGPGKYTLPLAKLAARVMAVEPSEQMAGYLRINLAEHGVENVNIVQKRWEDAQVDPVDAVLCSHVLYDVEDVESFLLKLDAHATGLCILAHHIGQYDPLFRGLWQRIYGEERRPMPVFADLLRVLDDLGIPAAMAGKMPPHMRLSFVTMEEAIEYCTERMALEHSDLANHDLVEAHLGDLLEMVDGRLYAPPSDEVGVVWWVKGKAQHRTSNK